MVQIKGDNGNKPGRPFRVFLRRVVNKCKDFKGGKEEKKRKEIEGVGSTD